MSIRCVRAFPLQYPEPHDHNKLRYITLVRITDSSGQEGWGECISQFPESACAVKTIIEAGYAPLLHGEDPLDVERLWRKLLARVWWYGPQGIAAFGISAVDMALWDLKGKIVGLPVCRLLGSMMHNQVLAMASIHFNMDDFDWTLNEFRAFREEGYRVVKGGWGKTPESVFGLNPDRDLELACLVREELGPNIDLVFDVLGARLRWSLPHAIRMIRALEEFRLRWIEEPMNPRDYESHAALRRAISTKIGTGEQEWEPDGYYRLLQAGGVDVVQLDPGRCLGITGSSQSIRLIEAHHRTFSMHTWSSAINTAASVHLLACSNAGECMDFKPHESPMQHELVENPWIQRDGYLQVRETPGLGVAVREDAVRKYEFAL